MEKQKNNNYDVNEIRELAKAKKFVSEEIKTEEKNELPSELPKEVQEKLKHLKEKLEKFSKEVIDKFEKYIIGVALLPPSKPEEGKEISKEEKEKINVLVLVDDSDSKKMTKEELREKLSLIIEKIAKDIDTNLSPQTLILSDLWQSCYDGKYDLLEMIAMSAPIYDTGMLSAIKIAEVHKGMVLKKFEKYIVCYVLAGSLVQGRATKESDIDVFIVIDDTDVKKMTRVELKDKLRAIIIGMGIEAGELTGIKNKLNIQVYILTDFWESIKEANPIIFTFLRDGVPFFDRGVFMPWKLLLKMGRIRPSGEAIEMYMSSGEQMIKRVEYKLNDIGIEDIFYAILTPSQAALMLYGLTPPTPRETPPLMREIFVEKEKLMEEKYVKILERVIDLRKDIEHHKKKNITGKEIDELVENAKEYLERLKKLFNEIEKRKEEEGILHIYETTLSIVREILRLEGIERVKDEEAINLFKSSLIETGKVPERYLRLLSDIFKAKSDYDAKKVTTVELEKIKKESNELIRFLVEYLQRRKGRELERVRMLVKYGKKRGEVVLLGKVAYIIHDVDSEQKEIHKADVLPDGSFTNERESSFEELEKDISEIKLIQPQFINSNTFESLKKRFGPDVQILINY